jgi:protoporphyrinogen oxidase
VKTRQRQAIIIGAGPAGLTAAYELLERTDIKPVVLEATTDIGGISKTVNYKGNRIDIGGHRFFSKSDRVMRWWLSIMPLQDTPARADRIVTPPGAADGKPGMRDPEKTDLVMLVRRRLSRIFYLRKFFPYPVSLSVDVIRNLGIPKMVRIAVSYAWARLFPVRPEKNLEDFFINRFGTELYQTFFKDYTEKVWGVPCRSIKPEWGAQRIKGLSITNAVLHAVKKHFEKPMSAKEVETTLIGEFYYPKLGPGQMWEEVAHIIKEKGGSVELNREVTALHCSGERVVSVDVKDKASGNIISYPGDYFFSTMPVRELIAGLDADKSPEVAAAAQGLRYRDFITVGLLLKKLKIKNTASGGTVNGILPDNWIYIQEPEVKLGRLQIFNNWSPSMVRDPGTVWVGLEYFCNEGDDLWTMPDPDFTAFAIEELVKIDMIAGEDVLDSVVIRMPKAYPAYFDGFEQFEVIRKFTDRFTNLFLIGRNGMHRYNNADHSMLTAMTAVDTIVNNTTLKDSIWSVNTEEEYHEKK